MNMDEQISRSSLAFANSTTLQQYNIDPNIVFNVTIHPDEDWTILTDPVERRRVQNRIAQRGYRNRLKHNKKAADASSRDSESEALSLSESGHSSRATTSKEKKGRDPGLPTILSLPDKPRRQNDRFNQNSKKAAGSVSKHHSYVQNMPNASTVNWETPCETSNESHLVPSQHFQPNQQHYQSYLHSPSLAMADMNLQDADMSQFDDQSQQLAFTDSSLALNRAPEGLPSLGSYPTSCTSSETSSAAAIFSNPKDFKHVDGGTALHRAAFYGHESVVEALLSGGADPEAENKYGLSTLHLVALKGHQRLVRLLLDRGADINARTHARKTAMHLAVKRDQVAVVNLLLSENRLNINARDLKGQTALHIACRKGYGEAVRLLLTWGVDANIKDHAGQTPLDVASLLGREAIVKMLV